MLRVVLGEVRNRRGRALALLLGILVATTSFTVLTGESASQRLDVRGTVARSFRGDYDILVRPRGARDPLEQRTQSLRPNFLSDTFGGIATAQWRHIQRLPGVQVAAPLANVGYLLPTIWLPVRLDRAAIGHGRQLLRARVRWRSEDGLTRVDDPGAQYAYVTPHRLLGEPFRGPGGIYRRESMRELVPGRAQPLAVCNSSWNGNPAPSVIDGPFTAIYRSKFGCYSRASSTGRFWPDPSQRGREPVIEVPWVFPLLLTAVDPRTEARLTGLDHALTAGRYLRGSDRAHLERVGRGHKAYSLRVLPVLAASRTYEDEQAAVAIERLPPASVDRWIRPFHFAADSGDFFAPIRFLIRQPDGRVVQRATISAGSAYRALLRAITGAPGAAPATPAVWRTAPIGFRSERGALHPVAQPTAIDSWKDGTISGGLQWSYVSPSARDRAFRQVHSYQAHEYALTPPAGFDPSLNAVGTFDPDRMGGAPQPGTPALRTIQPSLLSARDEAARRRLHGRPLRANGHLGGYLAQPPALITSLRAARAYGGDLFPDFSARRPISAVRVRVAGVTGIDALSRERIRQAALRIATATGLDVDIMAGASGAPTAIDLPAGRYGRPALALSETWVRKGVATRILSAIDRKSLVLFALILVVCALFVANAASAAVRARRTELGILSSLGWSAGRLFGVVLLEVGGIGLCAGLLGSLLALPLAALVGVSASLPRAALAVASATVLALLAGLAPAARAARSSPVAAVRPIVLETRRAWQPHSLGQLALVNLIRTPGRTLLGSLSLAIGVCALTLLLAATLAFHDVLVGTLLGDAVSVQVRSSDYVAVASTVVLGLAAVADVLFLNLRERAAEFATLSATGWDDRALTRLVAFEGAWLGALGAFAGAAVGLAAAAAFAGALPASLVLTALGAAASGTALAALTGLLPAFWLRRMPAAPLLAGE